MSVARRMKRVPASVWLGAAAGLAPLATGLLVMALQFELPRFVFPSPIPFVYGGVLIGATAALGFARLRAAGVAALVSLFLSLFVCYGLMLVYFSFTTFPG